MNSKRREMTVSVRSDSLYISMETSAYFDNQMEGSTKLPDMLPPDRERCRHSPSPQANTARRNRSLWGDSRASRCQKPRTRSNHSRGGRTWWWGLRYSWRPSLSCSPVEATSMCPSFDQINRKSLNLSRLFCFSFPCYIWKSSRQTCSTK